jgi:hypothetical protein
MSKKLWIFGDSYGEPSNTQGWQWPKEIRRIFEVENHAITGCGPATQLQLLYDKVKDYEPENLADINLLFFISDPMRKPYNFYKTPFHQTYIKTLISDLERKAQWRMLDEFKDYHQYNKYIKKDLIFNDIDIELEVLKYVSTLKLLSKHFQNTLVYTNFNELDNEIVECNDTKFCFVNSSLINVDEHDNANLPNHMCESNHKIMYGQLASFFLKGTQPNINKFLNVSSSSKKNKKILDNDK